MEKRNFLTVVSEVMKRMITYDMMMTSLQRSCMRPQQENIDLMKQMQDEVDAFISSISTIAMITAPDDLQDVLVLRFLRNTQFLARIKEDRIDVSGLDGDLAYWKKTMLFRAPREAEYAGKPDREPKE